MADAASAPTLETLPQIFQSDAFLALEPDKREAVLNSGLADAHQNLVSRPGYTAESEAAFTDYAKAAREKLGSIKSVGETVKPWAMAVPNLVKGLAQDAGTAAVAVADAGLAGYDALAGTPEGQSYGKDGEIAKAYGASLLNGLQRLGTSAQDVLARGVDFFKADSPASQLKTDLGSLKADIDAGKFPTDPEKFKAWISGHSDSLSGKQVAWNVDFTKGAVADPSSHPELANFVDPNSPANQQFGQARSLLGNPQTKQALVTYLTTRDPKAWDVLTANVLKTAPMVAVDAKQDAALASEGGKQFDAMFGEGASQHIASSSDPLLVAGFVIPALRGAKALTATETLGGLVKGTAKSAAIGAGFGAVGTLEQNPQAPLGEVATEAAKMALAAGVLHAVPGAAGLVLGKGDTSAPGELPGFMPTTAPGDEVLVAGAQKAPETPVGAPAGPDLQSGAVRSTPPAAPAAIEPGTPPEAKPETLQGLRDRRVESITGPEPGPMASATADSISKVQKAKDMALAANDSEAAKVLQQVEAAQHQKLAVETLLEPKPEEPKTTDEKEKEKQQVEQDVRNQDGGADDHATDENAGLVTPETPTVESTQPPVTEGASVEPEPAKSPANSPPETVQPAPVEPAPEQTPPAKPTEPASAEPARSPDESQPAPPESGTQGAVSQKGGGSSGAPPTSPTEPVKRSPIDPEKEIRLAHADEAARRLAEGKTVIENTPQGTVDDWQTLASRRVQNGEGQALVSDLIDRKRVATPVEDYMMKFYAENLERARAEADAIMANPDASQADKANAAIRKKQADDERERLALAANLAGSAWGAAGNARGRAMNRDEIPTFPKLIADLMTLKGKAEGKPFAELTPEERQQAEERHARLTELDAAQKSLEEQGSKNSETEANAKLLADTQAELAQAKADLAAALNAPTKGQPRPRFTKRVVDAVSLKADAARERLKARGIQFNSGIDPTAIPDYAIIMAEYIAKGVDAGAEMIRTFGNAIAGGLKDIEAAARALLAQESKLKTPDELKAGLRDAVQSDPERTIGKNFAQELAKAHIRTAMESGTQLTRAELNDAVLKDLKEFVPEITMQEARDLRTGYGKVKYPSDDPVDIRMRELNRIDQLFSSLERAETIDPETGKGKPGLKTGFQREKPTAEIRDIQKKLNDAMIKNGVETHSPEFQTASRREGIRNRLNNEIEDLDNIIAGITKARPERLPFDYSQDKELQDLKDHRDNLKDIVEAMPENVEASQNAKDAIAIKAAQDAEKQWNERADALDFSSRSTPTPERSAAVTEARAKAKEARDRWQKLKSEAERPAKEAASEKAKNDAAVAAAEKAEKEWNRRADELDFGKSGEPPAERVQRVKDARAKAAEARSRYEDLKNAERANQPAVYFNEISRKVDEANKRIAELEAKLARGDTTVDPPDTAPTHPLLEEKRAKIDEINKKIEKLRNNAKKPARDAARAQRELDEAKKAVAALEAKIARGDLSKNPVTGRPVSAELAAERAKLKDANKRLDKLRRDAEKPAREAKAAAKELQDAKDAVAKLEQNLARGDLSLKPTPARTIPAELKAERDRLKELNKELAKARNAAKARPSPDEVKLRQFKERVKKQLADMRMRRVSQNFAKQTRSPAQLKLDAEGQELEIQKQKELQGLEQDKAQFEREARTNFRKTMDFVVHWAREFKLLHPTTVEKLTGAGLENIVTRPIGTAIAQIMRPFPVLRDIRSKAVYEGRVSVRSELKGLQGTLLSAKSVLQKAFKGKSDIDWLNKKKNYSEEDRSYAGQIHGAIKEPVRQGIYSRSLQLRLEEADEVFQKTGDPNLDPAQNKLLFQSLSSRAYEDANRDIFMGDNIITKGIRTMLSALRNNKLDPDAGKLIADFAEIVMPIINVPSNIFWRIMQLNPIVGFGDTLRRIYRASKNGELANGAEKISGNEADAITRSFKYGVFGLGLAAYAWNNPKYFGGYYTPGGHQRKETDLAYGEIKTPLITINHHFAHGPVGSWLNIVADSRRKYDEFLKKHPGENGQAAVSAAAFSILAPVGRLPFVDPFVRAFGGQKPAGQVFAEYARGSFLPADTDIAAFLDRDTSGNPIKRKAETPLQEIELGIPKQLAPLGIGTRKDVPQSGKKTRNRYSAFTP